MLKAKGKKCRVIALAMAVLMCVSMMPAGAFAVTDVNSGSLDPNETEPIVDGGEGSIDDSNGGAGNGEAGGNGGAGNGEAGGNGGAGNGEAGGNGGAENGEAGDNEGAIEPTHVHSMKYVEKVDATCQESGVKAYYLCKGCGKKFFDAAGTQEVTNEESLIIPIKEHDWDDGVVDPDDETKLIRTCKVCGTTKRENKPVDPQPVYPESKSVKLNGNSLKFKTAVVTDTEQIEAMDKGRIDHVWLKAAKSKMTLNWKVTKSMKFIDGVIILRKTGTAKTYKEIAVIPFKTVGSTVNTALTAGSDAEPGLNAVREASKMGLTADGTSEWAPKKKYTDKTAANKDTPYSYIVVSYLDKDEQRFISHCSDWAAGQTTASMLKTVNTAVMSSTSEKLQYKGTVKLKLTYDKPKETYNAKSFRWYTDDKKVAKVSSSGKVTAAGVGSTTIRGRLSSGDDITCKIKVVGAFKPGKPKLSVDTATDTTISLKWNKTTYATEYDVYRSDDGLHWNDPVTTKDTGYTFKKLTKNHRYTFYVVARNVNHGYSKESSNSNVVNQKAVQKRRATKVTGFPTKVTLKSGSSYKISIKVTSPDKRKASLQMYEDKKWVTKKTITLPEGSSKKTVKVLFPNDWWGKKSSWRLVIPQGKTSDEYTSATLKISTVRQYQNPSQYIQIKNKISKHGYEHYIAPVLINDASTRDECVRALLDTANKYLGDPYAAGKTQAPGKGIDAGGLVIEACYGAGIDLWPVSPSTRETNAAPEIMDAKLKKVTNYGTPTDGDFPEVYRGDLIFFKTSKNKVAHVAIYLGYGKIIHASKTAGKVETTSLLNLLNKKGKYKYTIAGVRRVFA